MLKFSAVQDVKAAIPAVTILMEELALAAGDDRSAEQEQRTP